MDILKSIERELTQSTSPIYQAILTLKSADHVYADIQNQTREYYEAYSVLGSIYCKGLIMSIRTTLQKRGLHHGK